MKKALGFALLTSMFANAVMIKYYKDQNKVVEDQAKVIKSQLYEKQERFNTGFKYGVFASNTAINLTKDFSKKDKSIYWKEVQAQALKLNIELK
jgi:hypothetical protein